MDRKFIQDLAQRALNMQVEGNNLLDRQYEEINILDHQLAQFEQVLRHALELVIKERQQLKPHAARLSPPPAENVQQLEKKQR
jgi:hypothetical protein